MGELVSLHDNREATPESPFHGFEQSFLAQCFEDHRLGLERQTIFDFCGKHPLKSPHRFPDAHIDIHLVAIAFEEVCEVGF